MSTYVAKYTTFILPPTFFFLVVPVFFSSRRLPPRVHKPIMSSSTSQPLTLIPGLPNDISSTILSLLPPSHRSRLKSTSRAFHAFLSSPDLHTRHPLLCVFPSDPSLSPPPYLFDPAGPAWKPITHVPCSTHFYGLSNFAAVAVGRKVYLIGGSQFDARAYPLGQPTAAGAVVRIDLGVEGAEWERMTDLTYPRGSFACAAVERWNMNILLEGNTLATGESKTAWSSDRLDENWMILVAGGGSRHTMFPSVGSRSRLTEAFDVSTGKWMKMEPLPKCRAGCVGWVMDGEQEKEFWVMGGYGGYRTVSGLFPADVNCRDGAVFGLRSGKWREIGNMWEDGERRKLGAVAVIHGEHGEAPGIFMLDQSDIFKYDVSSNYWHKEATLPRKILGDDEACGFVTMNGELHIISCTPNLVELHVNGRKPPKKKATLDIQVYHPKMRKWRFMTTTTPFNRPLNFNIAVLCTVHI